MGLHVIHEYIQSTEYGEGDLIFDLVPIYDEIDYQ